MHLSKNIQLLKKKNKQKNNPNQQPKNCTSQEPTYSKKKKKKSPEQNVPSWKAKTRQDLTQKVLDIMNWQIHINLIGKAHPIVGYAAKESTKGWEWLGVTCLLEKIEGEGKRGKGTRDFNSSNTPCITIFCFPFSSLITIIKATLGKWKLERKKQF